MRIIYEDEAIAVTDKPSGITVNRSDTTRNEKTVQDWVDSELKIDTAGSSDDLSFKDRSGIVHRLDKETSGILLIAKTMQAFESLQKQFKDRLVEKAYKALVHGRLTPSEGEIVVPVGRLPWNRKRFGILAGGREATTNYKVLEIKRFEKKPGKTEELSLLEAYPKTGRTHQIRVHLKYCGHPIFSDSLYAGRKVAREDRKFLPRLFLHAAKISFIHPLSEKRVSFDSDLPEDLSGFLRRL
ncbi:MAG: hypothetical protein ACD_37C00625G0001 [uncultured bacterium]|nr:MAG: hypothetical protein ACD_37C00625G0001 [uncultured bacterium]KKR17131.1 MAG: Pseudouridine synthase [Candidatus Levybacteria bacterium GW2011_GWA1_39_32]KKR50606.1 MAG: Pseudouridine synthase [Candidatus Levybacteria bacterium GW2011_GWC1_40_19]KKR73485.1 MAG: Pseudouridine synthase [Candidatus Levybacteria bacterium GW2011_GWC2_40_7]KKR94687.1 MAG: Pseudouridine synthase [Candidatus Levybacteria bacterium GW2011_GWA2_41_15]KKS01732.1 MAG: Pseudouridine synthase [Candidatus Levybacteri